jgi:hypothetical protein
MLSIGIGLCFENLLVLVLIPAIIIPAHIITTRMEESHLQGIFGIQYDEYKRKVPAFWPRFSNYNSPDELTVNLRSIRRITADTIVVLLIPQIEDFLELLHENGIIPVLWHFPS